jgi:hypothetical protein
LTVARAPFHSTLIIGTPHGVAEAPGPLLGAWILYALLRRHYEQPAITVMTGSRADGGRVGSAGRVVVDAGDRCRTGRMRRD